MSKKEKVPLTPVVQPEPQLPDMGTLRRAAASATPQNLQPPAANTAHNAWANYRAGHVQTARRPSLGELVKAPPPPLTVVPLSRREQRPKLAYIRPVSVNKFELVTHNLVDGELLEPQIKPFGSLEAAYDELMLQVVAQRERALKALADFKRDSGLEDSDEA